MAIVANKLFVLGSASGVLGNVKKMIIVIFIFSPSIEAVRLLASFRKDVYL